MKAACLGLLEWPSQPSHRAFSSGVGGVRVYRLVDDFVTKIYRAGFVQSLILHTGLLLALALMVVQTDSRSGPVALAIRFDSAAEPVLFQDMTPPIDVLATPVFAERSEPSVFTATPVALETEHTNIGSDAFEAMVLEPQRHADNFDQTDLLTELPVSPPTAVEPVGTAVRYASANQQSRNRGLGGRGVAGDGIDGELGRRLRAAGARSGDVQVSIRWDNINDIDVHVTVEPFTPGAVSLINFASRLGRCGGMLDVDANANSIMLTRQPVENVFWGRAPYGRYTVAVHHYRNWSGQMATPVEVAVLVDGEVHRFQPVVVFGGPPVVVTSFVRTPPAQAAKRWPAVPASGSNAAWQP